MNNLPPTPKDDMNDVNKTPFGSVFGSSVISLICTFISAGLIFLVFNLSLNFPDFIIYGAILVSIIAVWQGISGVRKVKNAQPKAAWNSVLSVIILVFAFLELFIAITLSALVLMFTQ